MVFVWFKTFATEIGNKVAADFYSFTTRRLWCRSYFWLSLSAFGLF